LTKIKYKISPVWHETGAIDGMTGRPYVVAETPINLLMRLKGTRQVLSLPWSVAYLRAAQLKTMMNNLQKGNAKRARSVSRGRLSKK
jgi:hypothetical protein